MALSKPPRSPGAPPTHRRRRAGWWESTPRHLTLAVATALVLGLGCAPETDTAPRAGTVPEPGDEAAGGPTSATAALWRPVGSWSGRDDRQTESFDVTTGALRLAWEASSEAGGGPGRLTVTVHSAISGRPLHTMVDHAGPGADTVLAAVSPRVAHLQIESEHVDWRLTLEERAAESTREADR